MTQTVNSFVENLFMQKFWFISSVFGGGRFREESNYFSTLLDLQPELGSLFY